MMMSKFMDIRENTAVVRGVTTQSPGCALGWRARFPHLTTIDVQRATAWLEM